MNISEDDIFGVAQNVWGSMLDLAVEPCPAWVVEGDSGVLDGCVEIRGAWSGKVILTCPRELARQVAGLIFGVAVDDTSTVQACEAIAELTNMTAGNLKALLPEPCELGLPIVSDHEPVDCATPGTQAGLSCDGHAFLVKVIETGTA